MKIGVLALQGDVEEHLSILKKLKVNAVRIIAAEELKHIDGLIIPGGESTTISKLILKLGLDKEIISLANKGMPIYGTCAGAILLSKDIKDSAQPRLGLLDLTIERNSYGRQIDSFETDIYIEGIGKFNGIFIRAPIIKDYNDAKILSRLGSNPIFVISNNIMITTFHPELTNDTRVHKLFIKLVKDSGYSNSK